MKLKEISIGEFFEMWKSYSKSLRVGIPPKDPVMKDHIMPAAIDIYERGGIVRYIKEKKK